MSLYTFLGSTSHSNGSTKELVTKNLININHNFLLCLKLYITVSTTIKNYITRSTDNQLISKIK